MAIEDRQFGWDVSVLGVDGTSVLAMFTNCKLGITCDTDSARATHDTVVDGGWRNKREKSRRWTIDIGAIVEVTPLLFDKALTGGIVPILLTGGGLAFGGDATFTGAGLELPDGADMEDVQLIGSTPLALL